MVWAVATALIGVATVVVACDSGKQATALSGTGGAAAATGGAGGSQPASDGGGTGGAGGADLGGTGGATGLPLCDGGPALSFGICVVNDADVVPIRPGSDTVTVTTGTAIITDVGLGSAPAQCEDARVFGGRGSSDWWFRAKSANGRLWTFGLHGLGAAPRVAKGDTVSLDLSYQGFFIGLYYGPPLGRLQVQDSTGLPLLWVMAGNRALESTWITLARGAPACAIAPTAPSCSAGGTQNEVRATVNGETVTLPPFGTGEVGGYRILTGEDVTAPSPTGNNLCADYYGEAFAAAAIRLP
jgi:hypothetical protein